MSQLSKEELPFLPLLKFKKANEDPGVRNEKNWMTQIVIGRAGTRLEVSWLIPDGCLALGEQCRKIRLA